MIECKSPREIALMRAAGRVVATVFKELEPLCRPGVSTAELNQEAGRIIRSAGATPTFLGYGGFPGNICVSVNDTLIHGIPSKKIILKEGDIVSLDVGATLAGYCADAARTFAVGNILEATKRLVQTTEESFWEAVKTEAKPGHHLSNISHAIQNYCEARGYTLTPDYTGHGIGRNLHEDPMIPNVGEPGHGPRLKTGMCLAIEPMVNAGGVELDVMPDQWTVKTHDGQNSAHYENTIVITETGCQILTVLPEITIVNGEVIIK
ncbi:MAG: type I methionyl aminopeptidase [Bacilli bacterium]|jgi:methionyl aminopeptidase|nr:type I methionyl aminopeptidase [Bacilli bacterium]MDD3388965.1 type I methionyl aminopeptidase [Bacilli bacterium]MDD4520692.1 type I methionyl aminopeptidase [Bacilli bacterium]MDY0399333.1 type I methionyl aminopeptidase [Bacilli bacterium]HKM11493.1 type I methionyl aminopeptidase [Bacilli bacterium]